MPISASNVSNRSDTCPARIALNRPNATPKAIQMIAAPIASANVRGTPFQISSVTLSWVK